MENGLDRDPGDSYSSYKSAMDLGQVIYTVYFFMTHFWTGVIISSLSILPSLSAYGVCPVSWDHDPDLQVSLDCNSLRNLYFFPSKNQNPMQNRTKKQHEKGNDHNFIWNHHLSECGENSKFPLKGLAMKFTLLSGVNYSLYFIFF